MKSKTMLCILYISWRKARAINRKWLQTKMNKRSANIKKAKEKGKTEMKYLNWNYIHFDEQLRRQM